MASKDIVEEIKRRVDLVEIASAYVKLRRAGRNWEGLCPFHQEKTPSFSINPEKQVWYCFGCGSGGDVFSFVQKADGLTFREALEKLAARTGVRIDAGDRPKPTGELDVLRSACETAAAFYQQCLKRSREAQDYLRHRGIDEDTSERFRLGYAPDEWSALADHLARSGVSAVIGVKAGLLARAEQTGRVYDRMRGRVVFPICDVTGRVIAFGGRVIRGAENSPKYLNSPESPLFVKGSTLYGLHLARTAIQEREQAVLVEGYFDVVSLHGAGIRNAVATLGTALTREHLNLLGRYIKSCVLLYDSDSAGLRAALRSIPLFEESELEVRIAVLPDGHDPDSFVRTHGATALAEQIRSAQTVLDYQMGLLIRRFGTEGEEAKRKLVSSAVPILARVQNHLELGRWTRRLAEIWCGARLEMAASAEESIVKQISEYRRRARGEAVSADTMVPKPLPTGSKRLQRAQECILKACLESRDVAEAVFREVQPEHFTSSELVDLARLVRSHLADDEWDAAGWDLGDGPAAVLAGRLMADREPVLGPDSVMQCCNMLKSHWEHEQVQELIRRSQEGEVLSHAELRRIEQSRLQRKQYA
ncbi:MAG: DNA primase [Armatimonadota bacterium]